MFRTLNGLLAPTPSTNMCGVVFARSMFSRLSRFPAIVYLAIVWSHVCDEVAHVLHFGSSLYIYVFDGAVSACCHHMPQHCVVKTKCKYYMHDGQKSRDDVQKKKRKRRCCFYLYTYIRVGHMEIFQAHTP